MGINITFGQTKVVPSEEQQAAIDWLNKLDRAKALIVEASAGSGKTFMLIEMVKQVVRTAASGGRKPTKLICLLAYNRKVRKEIQSRVSLAGLDDWVDVHTFHSLGKACLETSIGITYKNIKPGKARNWFKARFKSNKAVDYDQITALVSALDLAKDMGFDLPLSDYANEYQSWSRFFHEFNVLVDEKKLSREEAISACMEAFKQTLGDLTSFDYADLTYLIAQDAYRFCKWRYKFIFVDEGQDLNFTRAVCVKSISDDSTIVVVGDETQAIYGYTGAIPNALDYATDLYRAERLSLTYCRRCPRTVIAEAVKYMPNIKAMPNASEGSVMTINEGQFRVLFARPLPLESDTLPKFKPGDAILCRINAPLTMIAFNLIKAGIRCKVEGKDLGAGLISYAKSAMFLPDPVDFGEKLTLKFNQDRAKLESKNNERGVEELWDKVSCIRVLHTMCCERGPFSLGALETLVEDLFADSIAGQETNRVVLSSVHRAKGLEWDRVFIYGRNIYMPSKYAKTDWEKTQENNLIGVAITRAKQQLIYVNL